MLPASKENGYRLSSCCPFFLSAVLFLCVFQTQATEAIQEVATVDIPGFEFATSQLSVRLIHQLQSNIAVGSAPWLSWEKKRLSLLSELGNWLQIIDSIDTYPEKISAQDQAWFVLLKATAKLKVARTAQVRDDIRQLIWSQSDLTTEQIAEARRLIIRSYLAENKAPDAQRAMLRYQQDYGDSDIQWKLLQTKVLLATRRFQQAVRLISKETDAAVQPVKKLTRLKAGLDDAQYVFNQAMLSNKQAGADGSQDIKRQNWILAYIAAGLSHNRRAEIETLERALVTGLADADKDLIALSSALLWHKYRQYAEFLGNKHHLLTGDDEAWYKMASDLFETQPTDARALFAYVGVKAIGLSHRHLALDQLSQLIKKNVANGMALIDLLFADPQLFDSVKNIILTLVGLVYAAAKSLAMIVLPAVLLASGVTAMLMYILK